MKPTTSIRSTSNVASRCVLLYRDRQKKKAPTKIQPSRGKRLWRYTRTCVAATRNACGQEFQEPMTMDRINPLLRKSPNIFHRAMKFSIQTADSHTWIILSTRMDVLGVIQLVKTLVLLAQLPSCTPYFRNAQVKLDKCSAKWITVHAAEAPTSLSSMWLQKDLGCNEESSKENPPDSRAQKKEGDPSRSDRPAGGASMRSTTATRGSSMQPA